MNKDDLLRLRKKIKSKKPKFLAQDTHKKKGIRKRWVKPRGSDSKMRIGFRGYRKAVQVGYGSPNQVEGLHYSGLKVALVSSLADILSVNNKEEGAIIASAVGLRKKIQILQKSKELNVKVLNVKDIDGYLKQAEERLKQKKLDKEKFLKTKERKHKEKEKASKEKADKEKKDQKEHAGEELADKINKEEERKIEEKKDKDKIITQRA